MSARENLVILASLALFAVLFLVGLPLFADATGVAVDDYPLLAFLLFVGLTVALPQLYLAATDDDVPPRTRVRLTVGLTVIFAGAFGTLPESWFDAALLADLEALQHALIFVIAGGAVLALLVAEFVTGYRSTTGADDAAR